MPETLPITQSQLQRLLFLGLGISALLLFTALFLAFKTAREIEKDTAEFADRQSSTKAAIDALNAQQADWYGRWLSLAHRRDVVKREEILAQLAQTHEQMGNTMRSAYEQAELLRESIYEDSHGLLRWTVWLFAACVVLSLAWASWTVRASAGLFRKLEQQASDLSQMQYQFLETQENTARRFSHELHDELGQTLTAMKANLTSLKITADQARVDDCLSLVDRATKEVREMSQLLRPTILDDFGLDPALQSLTESFSQRTGIEVQYHSAIDGRRLPDQAETNLYRIAQEALTNVARHSQATCVEVNIKTKKDEVILSIKDNGHGINRTERGASRGLGLAGMETRAKGCGGRLHMESEAGKGLEIAVTCPSGL